MRYFWPHCVTFWAVERCASAIAASRSIKKLTECASGYGSLPDCASTRVEGPWCAYSEREGAAEKQQSRGSAAEGGCFGGEVNTTQVPGARFHNLHYAALDLADYMCPYHNRPYYSRHMQDAATAPLQTTRFFGRQCPQPIVQARSAVAMGGQPYVR